MAVYYIGADVHCSNTELAVEHNGAIVQRHSVATTVRAIREVHHSRDERMVRLKRWVYLYEDRVREATHTINKVRACGRRYGLRVPGRALHDSQARKEWFASLACEPADQERGHWGHDQCDPQPREWISTVL